MKLITNTYILNLLPVLDLVCKRVAEASFDYNDEYLIPELGGELVGIDVDYPKEEVEKVLDYLYKNRLVIKYKDGKVDYYEPYKTSFTVVVRPSSYIEMYETYLYASLISTSLWDIQRNKRMKMLIELIHSGTFNRVNVFQNTEIYPEISMLGASSLSEFERLMVEDLEILLEERLIDDYVEVGNEISVTYSKLTITRLELSIDLYLESTLKDTDDVFQPIYTEFRITYTKDRRILLNDTYLLSKPNFDSENDNVFNFLYNNANQKWTVEEVQQKSGVRLTKTFDKIVENLGFKNDLRRMFFEVSKTAIRFNNPISISDLDRLGIKEVKI